MIFFLIMSIGISDYIRTSLHLYALDGIGLAIAEDEHLAIAENFGYLLLNSRVADSIRGFKISRVIGITVGGNRSWIVSVTILPTNKMRPLVTIGCHRELTTVRTDKCLVIITSIGIKCGSCLETKYYAKCYYSVCLAASAAASNTMLKIILSVMCG